MQKLEAINGKSSPGQFLTDGDAVTFGTTTLIFNPVKSEYPSAAKQLQAEETVVMTAMPEGSVTPSLILTSPNGTNQTYPLQNKSLAKI